MTMKDEVDNIHGELAEAGGNAATAYDEMKAKATAIADGNGQAGDGELLIAAMAQLWLSGVQYNARASLASGKILEELRDKD